MRLIPESMVLRQRIFILPHNSSQCNIRLQQMHSMMVLSQTENTVRVIAIFIEIYKLQILKNRDLGLLNIMLDTTNIYKLIFNSFSRELQ